MGSFIGATGGKSSEIVQNIRVREGERGRGGVFVKIA
jgi:hypothetical protein